MESAFSERLDWLRLCRECAHAAEPLHPVEMVHPCVRDRTLGGHESSRGCAAFGLHPFRRGTRLPFRCTRTVATLLGVPSSVRVGSSLPSAMFAAKSAPPCIRWHLMAARGAVTRLFRFSRRDARNGRRLCRLCAVASDLRLLMPASSSTSSHSGGIPPFPRHEWRTR